MQYKIEYNSPIGKLTLASDGENLVGLWIEGQKHFPAALEGEETKSGELSVFEKSKKWLDEYFQGKNPSILNLPLAPKGTEFRQKVWQALCEIPYGKTVTYKEIADKISDTKMSAQAVGGAVGHNPILIIIPCHRVIGSNGSLTGYAGGVELKTKLLKHEGITF